MIAYLAALAPIIFGTTYLLTSDFLPPGRPLLAALLRSLPTGLILVIGTRPPDRRWLVRLGVLSVLYASGLFPLLFLAAYLLPGGVAAVINSISPLLVVVLSVPLLGAKIHPVQVGAGVLGIGGVALLVLRSDARLDPLGLLAMTGAALMMGTATVLTKRWGRPPGMTAVGMTGWTFLLAGLTLLPVTLLVEGLPGPADRPQRRRPGLPGADQRRARVRAVVLGPAAPDRQLGHLPQPAQPGGRRGARLGGPRPAAQRLAAAGAPSSCSSRSCWASRPRWTGSVGADGRRESLASPS